VSRTALPRGSARRTPSRRAGSSSDRGRSRRRGPCPHDLDHSRQALSRSLASHSPVDLDVFQPDPTVLVRPAARILPLSNSRINVGRETPSMSGRCVVQLRTVEANKPGLACQRLEYPRNAELDLRLHRGPVPSGPTQGACPPAQVRSGHNASGCSGPRGRQQKPPRRPSDPHSIPGPLQPRHTGNHHLSESTNRNLLWCRSTRTPPKLHVRAGRTTDRRHLIIRRATGTQGHHAHLTHAEARPQRPDHPGNRTDAP